MATESCAGLAIGLGLATLFDLLEHADGRVLVARYFGVGVSSLLTSMRA
jgi:hypothetical protein